MKIQYPGVADSIDSDIDNVKLILDYTNLLPEQMYIDSAIKVSDVYIIMVFAIELDVVSCVVFFLLHIEQILRIIHIYSKPCLTSLCLHFDLQSFTMVTASLVGLVGSRF